MRIFIECAGGSRTKNRFDEATFALKESLEVRAPYPYPYGFIPRTAGQDGDCLDCFLLTSAPETPGVFVEAEVLGTLEFLEGGEVDHKVLCGLPGGGREGLPGAVEAIKAFLTEVFKSFPEVRVGFGRVLGREETLALIRSREVSS